MVHKKKVIVDLQCGLAVMRGADVFAPGVLAAPKSWLLYISLCATVLSLVPPFNISCNLTWQVFKPVISFQYLLIWRGNAGVGLQ